MYLDFDGGFYPGSIDAGVITDRWINTAAFDLDGASGFSRTEQAIIRDAWAAAAEDYAPFNINVTTVFPSSGTVNTVVIGDTDTRTSCGCSGHAIDIGPIPAA